MQDKQSTQEGRLCFNSGELVTTGFAGSMLAALAVHDILTLLVCACLG